MKNMKLTKRKGFNFFRSYFDVYNELNDEDKLAFIDALLNRQFMGVKPTNLTGMAKFAYISQTNSIDSQVKGYEDKTKTTLQAPPYQGGRQGGSQGGRQGGSVGGSDTPCLQVEEEEKEKVEVKEEVEEEVNAIIDVEKNYDRTTYRDINTHKEFYLKNERLRKAVSSAPKNKITMEEIPNRLDEFHQELESKGRTTETFNEYADYFLKWHRATVGVNFNATKGKQTFSINR